MVNIWYWKCADLLEVRRTYYRLSIFEAKRNVYLYLVIYDYLCNAQSLYQPHVRIPSKDNLNKLIHFSRSMWKSTSECIESYIFHLDIYFRNVWLLNLKLYLFARLSIFQNNCVFCFSSLLSFLWFLIYIKFNLLQI